MPQKQENIVAGTPEMMAAALADALELIRQGKWPAPYEGDDQLVFDDDEDLPPAQRHSLKAAE